MPRFKVLPEMELRGTQNIPLVKITDLPPGVKGNMKTVDIMIRVARQRSGHPKIRKLAINILNYYNTKSHNFLDESRAIGEYVQKKVRYLKDAAQIEQVHDPLTIIDQIEKGIARADCDDMALLIATLLLSIGHRPKFKVVRYKGNSGSYSHIYVVDYAKNGAKGPFRISLDAIIKNKPIGFEVPHKSCKEISI
jgi:hypothetical protein